MSEHLEAGQISRCVLGEHSAADSAHLSSCADCRHELEQFEQALHGMRGSVRQWSEAEFSTWSEAEFSTWSEAEFNTWSEAEFNKCSEAEFAAAGGSQFPRLARPAVSAVWSMAAILLLSMLGLRFSHSQRPAQAVFADSDAALMDEVRADMARPVPRGMEPLLALVSAPEDRPVEALP